MPCRVLVPCGKTAREGARADCAFVCTHSHLFHCPQHANAVPIELLRKEALVERNKFLGIPEVDEEAEAAAAAAAAAAETAVAAAASPPTRSSPASGASPSATPSSSSSATPSSSTRKRKASGGDGASAPSSPSRKRQITGGGGASAASHEPRQSTPFATPTRSSQNRGVFNAFNSA